LTKCFKKILYILVFKDTNTVSPFHDELFKDDPDIKDDHIHLDSTTAGWGCCCLQVTFQAESFEECIHLYDQLIPLCPIMVKVLFFFFCISNFEIVMFKCCMSNMAWLFI
jgi:hypothetical protein